MIRDEIKKALEKALGQVKLEHPGDSAHGDFSIFKAPLEIAEKIATKLQSDRATKQLVDKIEVVPPGFINFWLSEAAFSKELKRALKEGERYGSSDSGSGKTLVIDYSSPNIAKRFAIGHLRSTVIGQAIYNLYGFLGWKTIGDNHLGDWGTQFGMLIASLKIKNQQINSKNWKSKIKNLTIDDLEEIYIEFNKKAKEDPKLMEEARNWFKKLEHGDKEAREIWEVLRETSLQEFDRIYDMLGVKIDNAYGESFYEKMLPEIIKECIRKGVAREDEGALIIKYPGDELPPAIIRKSDGATTYLTRDLATIKFRLQEWDPQLIVYEVGAEQSLHFQQLFRAAELLWGANSTQFVHVKHGLYLSAEGKKFATRRGETVKLEHVLDEAVKRAGALAESGEVAKAVGTAAVKYFDLLHHPSTDIVFDWDKIFQLEGNSAPYLQYTFARTQSVLRKSQITSTRQREATLPASQTNIKYQISNLKLNNEEFAILRHFYRFPEVVEEAAESFAPNLLCNFLFDLAQKYNTFYNRHRIIGNDFRVALNIVVGNILKSGLGLLGIEAPSKM